MSAKVLTTINIKGGVSKTTSIGCIAELLAEIEKKVLIIDMDPQANISQLFRRYQTSENNINEVLLLKGIEITKENVNKSVQETDNKFINIIASNEELNFICNNLTFDTSRAQQLILKKAINLIKEEYDFILIDNTPFYNVLTINSLCAADYVITPVSANGFSYAGLRRLLNEIYKIKDEFNENLEFIGAYMSNVNKQKVVYKDLYENYKEELGEKFLTQAIRQDKNVDESNTAFLPLLTYSPKTNAVQDYRKLLVSLNILDTEDKKNVLREFIQEIKEKKDKSKEFEKEISNIKQKQDDLRNLVVEEYKKKTVDSKELTSLEKQIKDLENKRTILAKEKKNIQEEVKILESEINPLIK